MTTPLQDLIADLEIRIVTKVDQLRDAELDLFYGEVLELEQCIEKLYDTLALVADQIATEGVASW